VAASRRDAARGGRETGGVIGDGVSPYSDVDVAMWRRGVFIWRHDVSIWRPPGVILL
jgi:hypothetical protein